MTTVESLPAKWRAIAHELRYNPAALPVTAQRLEDCADELEAALAAQPKDGELMALADQVDEAIGFAPTDVRDRARLALHQLRTLASRRVTVDDAMVERACIASSLTLWDDPKWDKDGRRDKFRAAMRQALTAALQPDSGEG